MFINNPFKSNNCLLLLTILASSFLFSACGEHDDDDDDFVASAIVTAKSKPSIIDTGDRTQINIYTSQVHNNGILLKVRFEKALQFVPDTSYVVVKDQNMKEKITPLFNDDDKKYTYLVFFLSPSQFGQDNDGKVVFELKGIKSQKNNTVEVDPDVDDPSIPNDQEFDVKKPEFSPDSVSYVTIR